MATVHRISIVVIVLSVVAVVCQLWVLQPSDRAPHAIVLPTPTATTSVLDTGLPSSVTRTDDWAEPLVDLNGNDIDEAVGDYRVDKAGELYERHAPDTAVLHLSDPRI